MKLVLSWVYTSGFYMCLPHYLNHFDAKAEWEWKGDQDEEEEKERDEEGHELSAKQNVLFLIGIVPNISDRIFLRHFRLETLGKKIKSVFFCITLAIPPPSLIPFKFAFSALFCILEVCSYNESRYGIETENYF